MIHQHYQIQDHLTTLRQLWHRTHPGGFRGVERGLMMIILIAKLLFPSFWIRHYADIRSNRMKHKLIEEYVILKVLILGLILINQRGIYRRGLLITGYFIADLITYLAGIIILNKIHHKNPNLRRNIILLGINMVEIVMSFAIFYLGTSSLQHSVSGELITSTIQGLHFSIATFATVGYGDIVVHGTWGYVLSMLQMCTSFLFMSLVLSSVVSKLDIKSEQ